MIRRAGREKPCTERTGAARMRQARAFAEFARLDPESDDGPTRSAAVSNAVLAAIAAADVICCKRIGRHSNDPNHDHVLDMLREAGDPGEDAAKSLQALLGLENKAQYQETNPTVAEARKALRAMEVVMQIASRA